MYEIFKKKFIFAIRIVLDKINKKKNSIYFLNEGKKITKNKLNFFPLWKGNFSCKLIKKKFNLLCRVTIKITKYKLPKKNLIIIFFSVMELHLHLLQILRFSGALKKNIVRMSIG